MKSSFCAPPKTPSSEQNIRLLIFMLLFPHTYISWSAAHGFSIRMHFQFEDIGDIVLQYIQLGNTFDVECKYLPCHS